VPNRDWQADQGGRIILRALRSVRTDVLVITRVSEEAAAAKGTACWKERKEGTTLQKQGKSPSRHRNYGVTRIGPPSSEEKGCLTAGNVQGWTGRRPPAGNIT